MHCGSVFYAHTKRSKFFLVVLILYILCIVAGLLMALLPSQSEDVCCSNALGENPDGTSRAIAKSLHALQARAEAGNAQSQYELGMAFLSGKLGGSNVNAKAVKWFRKAAEQNQTEAQIYLGICYAAGLGVTKDEAESIHWWRQAAERNNPKAQSILGSCYADGRGVRKDEAEAVKWYRRAAEHNHADAQRNLAMILATSDDPAIRDGSNAIRFAQKAVAATDRKDSTKFGYVLGTLAAAFAETGQFEKAVSTQREAIALLKTEKEKIEYTSRLKLYEANVPYRSKN